MKTPWRWWRERQATDKTCKHLALMTEDITNITDRLVEKSGHSSFECCQNVYCASSPKHQGLSAALAISQSILAGTGGAWRMQGGGFAGTIQAFVPDALVKRYCAAMEALFGPGCCYLLSLREQGAVRVM